MGRPSRPSWPHALILLSPDVRSPRFGRTACPDGGPGVTVRRTPSFELASSMATATYEELSWGQVTSPSLFGVSGGCASATKAAFGVDRWWVAALWVMGWMAGTIKTGRISAARHATATGCQIVALRLVSQWLGTSPWALSDGRHLASSVYSHSHTMSVLVRGGNLRGRHLMSLFSISPESGMPNTQRSQQCLSRWSS